MYELTKKKKLCKDVEERRWLGKFCKTIMQLIKYQAKNIV